MKSIIVVRYGEIGLKGRNRKKFVDQLVNNISSQLDAYYIWKERGRIFIDGEFNKKVEHVLESTFGIQNFNAGKLCSLDSEEIEEAAHIIAGKNIASGQNTFKVETKRADKNYPMNSLEFSAWLGDRVLRKNNSLKVDVHEPDFTINAEIRENHVIITGEKKKGPGGLPVGTSSKALLLLSGGLDSPVAGWYAMRRGLVVDAIHFRSPPFTGEKALQKVLDLGKELTRFTGGRTFKIYSVNFAKAQTSIHKNVLEKYSLVIQRRMMMRIADNVRKKKGYEALITGENLGQVASQTLENIKAIGDVSESIVLRPLIGFDKLDIVEKAKAIDTFEISSRPYEDCCVMFLPSNPVTKARLHPVRNQESKINIGAIINETIDSVDLFLLKNGEIINREKA
ncbi:MAG: tRNA uracil 4-sulfurtransferase ThiI [Thermotogota bacterium]|nr:tRNA uracil 4-sulfurtransferase ThiI [Thermotogota bacterium]